MEHFIAGPGICLVKIIEPFSSCDFAILKDVDGPGELPGLRGARGLGDVPPGRGRADAEPGGQFRERLALAQVR